MARTTIPGEDQVPSWSMARILESEIIFSHSEEASKVDIIKRNTKDIQFNTNKKVKILKLQHVNDSRTKVAQTERQLQEDTLRAKNIDGLNKWQVFKVKKEAAIKAYVLASNAAKKKI